MSEVGIKYPFAIAGGSVVTTSNQSEIIGSRVTFCLGTQVGERVMRPRWGIDILQAMYELEGELSATTISNAINWAFRQWFPDYAVKEVQITADPTDRTSINVTVRYGNHDGSMDEVSKVGTPIPGGSEMFANEGR
jgi:phage baseplate assembly protein W